jgi:hypothetical protein
MRRRFAPLTSQADRTNEVLLHFSSYRVNQALAPPCGSRQHGAEFCNMSQTGRLQRLLEHRWLLAPLAVVIGLVSGFLLWVTLQNAYWDYWFLPKENAVDGFYTYPDLRYWFFDSVLLLWCVDGLIACGLSLRNVVSSRSISGWTYRTVVLYFVLLIVLILGGGFMLYVRSRGF